MFKISIDGSAPINIGLPHLAGSSQKLSGQQIAFELTNVLNETFGDGKNFSFAETDSGKLTLTRGDETFDLDVAALLASQGTADKVSLISDAKAATPEAISYVINKALAATKHSTTDFSDMVFEYDAVNRGFKITQSATPITAISVLAGSAAAADIFKLRKLPGEPDGHSVTAARY